MSENWETHDKGCPNRRQTVAYPGHACDVCRGIAAGERRGLERAIDDLDARIVRERDEKDGDGLLAGLEYAADCVRALMAAE